MKLRPFVGRFSIAFSLTTELTSERVVSTSGAAAVTVTLSATPCFSLKLTVESLPTLTTIAVVLDRLESRQLARYRVGAGRQQRDVVVADGVATPCCATGRWRC